MLQFQHQPQFPHNLKLIRQLNSLWLKNQLQLPHELQLIRLCNSFKFQRQLQPPRVLPRSLLPSNQTSLKD